MEGKSFDQVKEEGRKVWDKTLGVFDVEMDLDKMRTFYSCLYRSVLFPRQFLRSSMPVASRFIIVPTMVKYCRGICLPIPVFGILSVAFFRCLNLVYPSMNAEIQEGLLNTYKESGFLPEWASLRDIGAVWSGTIPLLWLRMHIMKDITPKEIQETLYEAMLKTANDCTSSR